MNGAIQKSIGISIKDKIINKYLANLWKEGINGLLNPRTPIVNEREIILDGWRSTQVNIMKEADPNNFKNKFD